MGHPRPTKCRWLGCQLAGHPRPFSKVLMCRALSGVLVGHPRPMCCRWLSRLAGHPRPFTKLRLRGCPPLGYRRPCIPGCQCRELSRLAGLGGM